MPSLRQSPIPVFALALGLVQLTSAVAHAQVLEGKPVPKAAATGTAAAQLKFESSLATGAIAAPFTSAPLSWGAYPGAASYHVLRYATVSSAPISVAALPQTQYMAHVLPGNSFVFRVVAYSSAGQPLDTTKSTSIATPAAATPALLGATCSSNAGAVSLGWNSVAHADDYHVFLELPSLPGPHGRLPASVYVDSNFVGNSLAWHYPGTTLVVESQYLIRIEANYALHDYPAAGKVTRVPASEIVFLNVNAYNPAGPCTDVSDKVVVGIIPPA